MFLLKILTGAPETFQIDARGYLTLNAVEEKAEIWINKRSDKKFNTLYLPVSDLYHDETTPNGVAVLALKNLITDGMKVVLLFKKKEAAKAELIKETLKTLRTFNTSPSQALLKFQKASDSQGKKAADALWISNGKSEMKYSGVEEDNKIYFKNNGLKSHNYHKDHYALDTLEGFLAWLHLKNLYRLENFKYRLVQILFQKGISLISYKNLYEDYFKMPKSELESKIAEMYHSKVKHFEKLSLSDLHNHPTSCAQPEFIIERIKTRPEIDWSSLNNHILIANRLKILGYESIQAIAHADDTFAMKKLISQSLDVTGSLKEYLLRYEIIKKVVTTHEDCKQLAYEMAQEAQSHGVNYLEMRYGVVLQKPKNILSDSEIEAYRQAKGEEKETLYRNLLKKSQLKETLESYFEGLMRFKKEHPDFEFGMLTIVDKSFSPLFIEFIADLILKIKKDKKTNNELARRLTGFDTAGEEFKTDSAGNVIWKYDARVHEPVFKKMEESGLFKTITSHAGESFASIEDGLEAIHYAIDFLRVHRIGHGVGSGINIESLLFQRDGYGEIYDAERIVRLMKLQEKLIQKLIDKNILVESNFSSNISTGNVVNPFKHPAYRLSLEGVKLIVGTDGTSMNDTQVSHDLAKMNLALEFPMEVIEKIIQTGNKLVKKIIDPK
jgi:adenosine deaminase